MKERYVKQLKELEETATRKGDTNSATAAQEAIAWMETGPSFIIAPTGRTDELKKLQLDYLKAIQDAAKPINEAFLDNLKNLAQLETNKGDADAILAVKQEVERMKADTQSPFQGTKWVSYWQGPDTVQLGIDGRLTADWHEFHVTGYWTTDKNNTEVVETDDDGKVTRYQLNADKNLVRGDSELFYPVK
ncbi:MAG TPA: hypothetical protein VL981_09415 [Candidatus Methylacidiphilales bacterium]|nr:hypothetical protein [Candidatus Methylacidiphilales bacterium]